LVCLTATFDRPLAPSLRDSRVAPTGIVFALFRNVDSDFARSPFDGPTVMWRMQRPDGLTSHLVLWGEENRIRGVWFLNKTALGMRDFNDLDSALEWADRRQHQNWSAGWRLLSEDDLPPSQAN
jgi:hypothetical protein